MTAASASRSLSKRLSRRILIITSAVFLAAIVIVGIVSVTSVRKGSNLNATRSLNNSILEIEKALTEVESATNMMGWVAMMASSDSANKDGLNILTSQVISADTNIVSCSLAYEPYACVQDEYYYMVSSQFDKSGKVVSRVLGGIEYDYLTMDWYQIAKYTQKPYWNDPEINDGRMITSYCKPLFDMSGKFFGVLKADVSLDWLTSVVEKFKPYESSETVIISHNGSFLTHSDKSRILNWTVFTDAIEHQSEKELATCRKIIGGESGITNVRLDGVNSVMTYAPLENGWAAIGFCSRKDFFENAAVINITLYLIALIGLIALYWFSVKTISRLTQPLTEFTFSAMNMAKGNFHATIPTVETKDEIKRLHDSLSYLQSSINKYIGELKTTTSTKERIESELSIASNIQRAMLPSIFPKHSVFDIYADLVPAKEIGGDLYDVIQDGNFLHFVVGDVSGKGVPAALFMSITRSAFRFTSGLHLSVAESISKINDNFSDGNEGGMFVTMFAGSLNLETLELKFCNAGHNPTVIVNPDGSARFLRANPNIAAGLFPGFPYVEESIVLEKGSRLIIYTDGVTEAETKKKDQYGEDRLLEYASSIPADAGSKEVVDGLFASVREFAAGNEQNDDITILSISL